MLTILLFNLAYFRSFYCSVTDIKGDTKHRNGGESPPFVINVQSFGYLISAQALHCHPCFLSVVLGLSADLAHAQLYTYIQWMPPGCPSLFISGKQTAHGLSCLRYWRPHCCWVPCKPALSLCNRLFSLVTRTKPVFVDPLLACVPESHPHQWGSDMSLSFLT